MPDDSKQLLQKYQPREVKVLKLERQMCMVRFSPCGKFLAAGGQDAAIHRWDTLTDQFPELPALTGHGGWVQAIAFQPTAPAEGAGRLYSADSWGKLLCWPYAEREAKPIWSIEKAHDGWIRSLAVSADGQRLATCGMDRAIRLWSAADGKKVQELSGHPDDVYSVVFHPDGKSLVTGDIKGVVRQWDSATGRISRELDARSLHRLDRLQETGGVRCLVFDRTGTTLACAGIQPKGGANVQGSPTILLFDWQTGQVRHTLKIGTEADGFVYDVHFHPAGFVMGVTSGNPGVGKFFFYRPGDEQPFFLVPKMQNCHSLAVHPNGTRLVVSATNGNSSGNGRVIGKQGDYPGNWSPLHVWDMP